ncbi:c-type cytochrome domain-containing protein [Spongiivirga citrea]|uniref:C-type cytochrome n=1 Tax=Spongiivirga citrea TaxID=1481457 RepID=A0A6M0CLB0_9FLAO|nr:c-type cytochrome domain-containing protein [Spongiivirga citrea]NER17773.1 c-type cytochrome [Spongiivirga citrea]
MRNKKGLYRPLFIGLTLVFGLLTIYAIKQNEPPRFVLFLGRFHPLLLHLPIGALVVTFFLDVLGRFQKNYQQAVIRNLLGFTSFFSILTCFLGYFLSLEGGYQSNTLDWHLYTGIGTAIVIALLFYLSIKPDFNSKKLFFPILFLSIIGIGIAGHYGSILTHGDSFLIEYARAPKTEKTIEVKDSLRLYANVVAKIFDKKCVQCHNASKQKGKLSLLTPASILKGGEQGSNVVAGNAQASLLYSRLLLPISDEEHMPPEGKEQLTKDEIWLVKHWINTGANFENYVTGVKDNDTLSRKLEKYLVFNKIEIPKASKSDIEEVRKAGFRVTEIVPGMASLNVKFIEKSLSKETIETLFDLKKQIVELDFHSAELTDEMTAGFNKFINLKYLRINSPVITDKALKNLKKLSRLEVLNLFNTSISNDGLTSLLSEIQPKKVYAWNTKVDRATAINLASDYKIDIQNSINEDFVGDVSLEKPEIIPTQTLFKDTIQLTVLSHLKNVDLHYTLDGSKPDKNNPIISEKLTLDKSTIFKVRAFKENWSPSKVVTCQYVKVLHKVEDYTMKKAPDERYPNPEKLFDLSEGSLTFSDGSWVGYFGNDLEATIDLGSIQLVNNVSFQCLEDTGSWIFYPKKFKVFTSSTKNGAYKEIGDISISRSGEGGDAENKKVTLAIPNTKTRYFKVKIENYGKLPDWHPSAGNPSWLFVDEIYFW